MTSPITTHILDTASGHPAHGVRVRLEFKKDADTWVEIAKGVTDDDGRITDWLPGDEPAQTGIYRVNFEVGAYFDSSEHSAGFYTTIPVGFRLSDPKAHYHIPLLLSPYGYTTYRGS
jgi:5-hydroxyisourate hydrolase